MICETCKQEMRWVNAGVSKKTNKPYNGFWACDRKCPKLPKTQNYAPTRQISTNLTPPVKTPDVNWDRVSFGKCKYGFMIELLNSEPDYNELERKSELLAKRAMRVLDKPEIKNYGNGDEVTQIPY